MNRLLLVLAVCGTAGCHSRAARVREFDGARAWSYLETQVRFGPRIPGTPAHDSCGAFIAARLRATADTLIVEPITHRTARGAVLHLTNYFARFRPEAPVRVLFLAHWDTKPHATQDPDSARRALPVPGADDGASGTAVLLAMADALKARAPGVGVDLLFVDGEDYGEFGADPYADTSDVLIGSRWFADHQPAGYPPIFAVLFDMVGAKGLRIYQEQNSLAGAPEAVDRVWKAAAALGYDTVFVPAPRWTLIDDHTALQRRGIHAIDVVDFDYPAWHTTRDTPDQVSAQSLQIVGDVGMAVIRGLGS